MNDVKLKRHPLVFLAFVLSLVIFVNPGHADMMWSAVHRHDIKSGIISTLICFAVVLIPLILGMILTERKPARWQKSKLAVATLVILAFGIALNINSWHSLINRKDSASQASEAIVPQGGVQPQR
jgi:hypothetical protein